MIGICHKPQDNETRCLRCTSWYNPNERNQSKFCMYCSDTLYALEKDIIYSRIHRQEIENIKLGNK